MTRTVAILLLVALSACSADPSASPGDGTIDAPTTEPSAPTTTQPTSDPPDTEPPPSAAPTTNSPSSTTPTTTPATTPATSPPTSPTETTDPLLPDDAACTVEWQVPMTDTGHITVARDGALFDIDVASGEYRCIAELSGTPTRLDWNPGGDRLLVDDSSILSADDSLPTGFAPGTAGISWSRPGGTALIAPSADGSELLHVSADDPTDVVDVSALATTWAAAYHPSGLAIISAGVDDAGRLGLFIADNRGDGLQRLVFLDDPDTIITDVEVAADGSSVVFVHDHTGGTLDEGVTAHVHRLLIPDIVIEDLSSLPDVVPTGLVVSDGTDQTVAWSRPGDDGVARAQIWRIDGTTAQAAPAPARSTVVGLLGIGDVVALVSPGDRSMVSDVWIAPASGDPVLVATGVSAATTRIIRPDTWQDPPLDIELQAVG